MSYNPNINANTIEKRYDFEESIIPSGAEREVEKKDILS